MRRIFKTLLLAFLIVSFIGVNQGYAQTAPMPVRDLIPELDDTYSYGSEERAPDKIYVGPNDTYIDEAAKEINLPLGSFCTAGILMLGNSTPKLETENATTAIVWVDADVDVIEQSFRIPADYHSGGRFKIITDVSASSTDMEMDFDVYVNSLTTIAAWDASATNQDCVQIKNTSGTALGIGSPEEDTLSVTTDFASLAIGDQVTIRLWRGDASDASTADLELYSVKFEYNY